MTFCSHKARHTKCIHVHVSVSFEFLEPTNQSLGSQSPMVQECHYERTVTANKRVPHYNVLHVRNLDSILEYPHTARCVSQVGVAPKDHLQTTPFREMSNQARRHLIISLLSLTTSLLVCITIYVPSYASCAHAGTQAKAINLYKVWWKQWLTNIKSNSCQTCDSWQRLVSDVITKKEVFQELIFMNTSSSELKQPTPTYHLCVLLDYYNRNKPQQAVNQSELLSLSLLYLRKTNMHSLYT